MAERNRTKNPLLDEWHRLHGDNAGHNSRTRPDISIDASAPLSRHELCARYAWAVPTETAIDALVEWSPIVEVGAGTGYWARLIADAGGEAVAYDSHPPGGENDYHAGGDQFYPVERGGPGDAGRHPDRTLFLCWPPFNTSMAYDAALAHLRAGGKRLIFVGEDEGGCTADDAFWRLLGRGYCRDCWNEGTCTNPVHRIEVAYEHVDGVEIPQWFGIHDRLTRWERR